MRAHTADPWMVGLYCLIVGFALGLGSAIAAILALPAPLY